MNSSEHAADVNGGNDDVFDWGVDAIAKTISRTPRQTYHLIATNQLKSVKKLGGRYVAHRRSLLRELGAE
jgi:hypothetical protein